ncbi:MULTISPECIES: TetR/AcrR family transcriptional regulator [Streptosporangium]|uniref:TetR/AcrR family transcriptional repressor of nem operon n=1 Tax=Streptosporangium brasiliense TaxID=47480 RepID=A0ABT9RG42_9ACTN|nr:helix-turn-helix domain-containing protein [Streptosporangium brasiliense]MDP9868243.1 TetR/AcrR family transcriptional repressor of nem operon [Streptosporangium brasiliense]
MGRPRGFDEAMVVQMAAELFASRSYDGISIDELVAHLGVHRNSLYKTFGSKRGLYLAALRWSLEHHLAPMIEQITRAGEPERAVRSALEAPGLDLLLMATAERAPEDAEVAKEVGGAITALDHAAASSLGLDAPAAVRFTAQLLGLRLRARASNLS